MELLNLLQHPITGLIPQDFKLKLLMLKVIMHLHLIDLQIMGLLIHKQDLVLWFGILGKPTGQVLKLWMQLEQELLIMDLMLFIKVKAGDQEQEHQLEWLLTRLLKNNSEQPESLELFLEMVLEPS